MSSSQAFAESDSLKPIIVKIGDKVVLNPKSDRMAFYDLTMDAELLIGLTLLKIGVASSLDEM